MLEPPPATHTPDSLCPEGRVAGEKNDAAWPPSAVAFGTERPFALIFEAVTAPFLIFVAVTALFFSCFVPTLFVGRLVAA